MLLRLEIHLTSPICRCREPSILLNVGADKGTIITCAVCKTTINAPGATVSLVPIYHPEETKTMTESQNNRFKIETTNE